MITTKEYLASVQVPSTTRTYSPISHMDLIGEVTQQIDKLGLKIKSESYSENRSGQQMFGKITIAGINNEQDMNVGFRNSYDKSMQIGVVSGSQVIVCSNMMFKGDFRAQLMHTGSVSKELQASVERAIGALEINYTELLKDSQKLKEVKVDKRIIAEILGEMFLHEDLITLTQLGIIKGELKEKVRFSDETLWDIYNHTTEALKTTPSGLIIPAHINAHEYFLAKA